VLCRQTLETEYEAAEAELTQKQCESCVSIAKHKADLVTANTKKAYNVQLKKIKVGSNAGS
jgi:hypothetical protein